jgi:hypothetical protein
MGKLDVRCCAIDKHKPLSALFMLLCKLGHGLGQVRLGHTNSTKYSFNRKDPTVEVG